MRGLAVALVGVAMAACHGSPPTPVMIAVPPPLPLAAAPTRGAAGDTDLRVMFSEIAASKACARVRGMFLPLPDASTPGAFSGVLWLHDCNVTQRGTHVTFDIAADGWQWVEQRATKVGGTFSVKQYVRFHAVATVAGGLDIAYSPSDHVMSLWFTTESAPKVTFTLIGGIDVDAAGVWASVVGGVGSVFGTSPSDSATDKARDQGVDQFQHLLADGLSATVDLCTGLPRIGLGRPKRGAMVAAGPGESSRVPVVLQPGGLMMFGPYAATHGMTIQAFLPAGKVHLAIMCHDQAEQIAQAFVARKPFPAVRALVERTVSGHATISSGRASCPVVVIASSVAFNSPPLAFEWLRPPDEAAASFGGAVLDCRRH